MLYHATDKKSGLKIWKNGLKSNKKINNNRSKRKSLRKHIDKIAQKQYNNYVLRENAIFAWTTFEAAERYSAGRFLEPAVVEFDLNGPAWCVENHISEDLFESYNSTYKDRDIFYIVTNYRKWHNVKDNNLEVWFQETSVKNVHRVLDIYGDPLPID